MFSEDEPEGFCSRDTQIRYPQRAMGKGSGFRSREDANAALKTPCGRAIPVRLYRVGLDCLFQSKER